MDHMVNINDILIGRGAPLVVIAGPCVIESYDVTAAIAAFLKDLSHRLSIPLIFKASYDKANRTSIHSFRGPGIDEGLAILARIKRDFSLPLLSDVHRIGEIQRAAQVLDVLQIPALLCRQTDIILEAARSGRPVNIKKGQFLAPWDMAHVVEKVLSTGNRQVMITERGSMFGYNNLVVDFRSIPLLQRTGCPVIFDATHSVQLPGGDGNRSGGQREFAPVLARAAVAAGADGIFLEVHPDPDNALSDGANSLSLESLPDLLAQLAAIRATLAPSRAPAASQA